MKEAYGIDEENDKLTEEHKTGKKTTRIVNLIFDSF